VKKMIVIQLAPQGVQNVQVIAESGPLEALEIAVLPIISEYLEKLDRRLRRMAKEAGKLSTIPAEPRGIRYE
jgi:hypothetical protein